MAQTQTPPAIPASSIDSKPSWLRKLFGKDDSSNSSTSIPTKPPSQEEFPRPGLARRLSRKVVPGLPRPGTFRRQQSELRDRLEPVQKEHEERRTLSVDRRRIVSARSSAAAIAPPRVSAPEFLDTSPVLDGAADSLDKFEGTTQDEDGKEGYVEVLKEPSVIDTQSISTQAFDEMILEDLEKKWILNLSMHFRDKSKREKFFVTYAETPTHWRRVTISLDYRNAPEGSLEEELQRTRFQRDKSARIYEAIRESLQDIQFYDTVTNLKLQTENDRLHVHVVEDVSEIIPYPPVKAINHLNCQRIREDELVFDSHLSGFVYKVKHQDQVFIKKEIPGPDTVDEFLYEINALHQLSGSSSVIQFGGVVLDNDSGVVKGLLISFAEQGALIDVLYDGEGRIPWRRRERWAKQIVQGLAEIHEAGFVQGDFTLSNIVIDADDNAKIIDINRRGCPVGWEPPEVAALIESNQRISMYIGVKSDLYQLGMVLYALATQQDEPENHRPLNINCFPLEIPEYYRDLCHRCLNDDPRCRLQASALLTLFPAAHEQCHQNGYPIPIVIDAYHSDERPYPNGKYDHYNPLAPQYPQSPVSEAPNVYDYAVTDTSTEPDVPSRGRSPPRFEKKVRPHKIPLPVSGSESDYLDTHMDENIFPGTRTQFSSPFEEHGARTEHEREFTPAISPNSGLGLDYLSAKMASVPLDTDHGAEPEDHSAEVDLDGHSSTHPESFVDPTDPPSSGPKETFPEPDGPITLRDIDKAPTRFAYSYISDIEGREFPLAPQISTFTPLPVHDEFETATSEHIPQHAMGKQDIAPASASLIAATPEPEPIPTTDTTTPVPESQPQHIPAATAPIPPTNPMEHNEVNSRSTVAIPSPLHSHPPLQSQPDMQQIRTQQREEHTRTSSTEYLTGVGTGHDDSVLENPRFFEAPPKILEDDFTNDEVMDMKVSNEEVSA